VAARHEPSAPPPIADPTSPVLSLHAASCIGNIPAVMSGMSSTAPIAVRVAEHFAAAFGHEPLDDSDLVRAQAAECKRSTAPRWARTVSRSGGRPSRTTASRSASAGPGRSGRTRVSSGHRSAARATSSLAGRDVRRLQLAGLAFRDHHAALEDAHALATLVERTRLDRDDPAVGFARGLALSRTVVSA